MSEANSAGTFVERLGGFVQRLRFSDLPPEVVEKIKVCLLHNLACALAGVPAAGAERTMVLREERARDGGARLLLDGARLTVPAAAFANAALVHARAQDDVHFDAKTHVGAVCTGTALALADASAPSGADFLTALVGGYEVTAAVGKLFGNEITARGFRATPVFAVFGAAAVASKLLGLDRAAVSDALGIAASFAGGLNECWVAGTPEWRFQVGMAARNGVLAAMLAREGGHGAPSALEGRAGFYRAFLGPEAVAGPAMDDLGARWETLAVVFKPHPVCSITQSPVSAALELLGKSPDLRPPAVERIRLWLRPDEIAYPGIDSLGPFNDVGATLMSAQFCVALALVYRSAPLRALSDFSNPDILGLVQKTELLPDANLPSLSCRLEVRTVDGRAVQQEVREGPESYNWDRERTLKGVATLAAEMSIPRDRLNRVVNEVVHLEESGSVGPLLDALMLPAKAST